MNGNRIKYILTIITILFFCLPFRAQTEKRDSVVVSLITCSPGSEIYELVGHEAVRVRGVADGHPIDSIWNYGVFNFREPNFVYRFVKGETDYMLLGYPFEWFMPEYIAGHREVTEQDLNLSPQESRKFLALLREEAKPENRKYRYNYVLDNCATRIVERMEQASDERIVYPDSISYGTFRQAMRSYHKNYPWYQFGIDIALGSGIDRPVTAREEMFAPPEMMRKISGAHFADGRPLVKDSRVLSEGSEDAVLPPTPFLLTPLAVSLILLIISIAASIYMWYKKRLLRWVYFVWFLICGLAGCVVAFLVFVSEHEATSPNILLVWLNPLQLFFAIGVMVRKMKPVATVMAYYNILSLLCLLIIWPFQPQSANPAFFPLMGITLILAAAWAIIIPCEANKAKVNTLTKKTTAKRNAGKTKRRK